MNIPQSEFVFFGTPEVSRKTLEILFERGFVPKVVITNPDAPKGRGLALTPSPTKAWALEKNIPILTPEKLDEVALSEIKTYGGDYALVVAYGKIFPESLISAFPKGVLNVHYSLLPKYRGATPMEAALRNGDTVTGVTVQKMVRALDAGDIIAQKELLVAPTDTARDVRPRLIDAGAALLADTLPAYLEGRITPVAQNHAHATHAGKLKKEDGKLELSAPDSQNWNTYRAYNDTIGSHFFTPEGVRVKIAQASWANNAFVVDRVIPEGRKEISYADFLKTK